MSKWIKTLASIAPTLATAIGGPLAGTAVGVVSQVLLGRGDGTEDEVSAALLTAKPDQLLAIKQADQDFKVKWKALDVENTKSARRLAIDTSIAPHVILSTIYTVGYFWLMWSFLRGDVTLPTDLADPFKILLGIMTAAQAQIMNFWFGSSSGSKEKTKRMR